MSKTSHSFDRQPSLHATSPCAAAVDVPPSNGQHSTEAMSGQELAMQLRQKLQKLQATCMERCKHRESHVHSVISTSFNALEEIERRVEMSRLPSGAIEETNHNQQLNSYLNFISELYEKILRPLRQFYAALPVDNISTNLFHYQQQEKMTNSKRQLLQTLEETGAEDGHQKITYLDVDHRNNAEKFSDGAGDGEISCNDLGDIHGSNNLKNLLVVHDESPVSAEDSLVTAINPNEDSDSLFSDTDHLTGYEVANKVNIAGNRRLRRPLAKNSNQQVGPVIVEQETKLHEDGGIVKEQVEDIVKRYRVEICTLAEKIDEMFDKMKKDLRTVYRWSQGSVIDLYDVLDEKLAEEVYCAVRGKMARCLVNTVKLEESACRIEESVEYTLFLDLYIGGSVSPRDREASSSLNGDDASASALSPRSDLDEEGRKNRQGTTSYNTTASRCSSRSSNASSAPEPPMSPRPYKLGSHPKIMRDRHDWFESQRQNLTGNQLSNSMIW